MNNLFRNWKTTSAGLLMIGGAIIHLVFAIISKTANENTWTIALFAVVGGIGLMFAGDSSVSADVQVVSNVAAAVDRVNKEGPSPFAQPAAENKPPGSPV